MTADHGISGGGGHRDRESSDLSPRGGKMLIPRFSYRYWEFLCYLALSLLVLHIFLPPSATSIYTEIVGYVGLTIEAVLPLPQIIASQRAQSCKGFRVSVLANWLFGDAMKMSFFFMAESGKIPWAFKMCGIFQACCDAGLGWQYWMYGEGKDEGHRKGGAEKNGRPV